jgi:hypothetical protein
VVVHERVVSSGRDAIHIMTIIAAPLAAAIFMVMPEDEGDADAEQAEHEEPVGPGVAGHRLEEPANGPSTRTGSPSWASRR